MALDLFFVADIERILLSTVVVTVETAQANGMANLEHLEGALMLAKGVALAFGVPWSALLLSASKTLGDDGSALLDITARKVMHS